MAGFKVHESIIDLPCDKKPISSLALVIGDLIEFIPGEASTWTKCTAASFNWSRKAIVMETVTTAATSVLAQELTGNELVAAESNANSTTDDNGNLMKLTDENTVANSGTTTAVEDAAFIQTGVLGAAAEKTILGHVLVGNSVDPAYTDS